ncbi:glutamate racemase [Allonocardiopsis opalescens]|uniref:glutamate racemase n=1 Tax=Allonocardiopsis opalescens TaxID=1144618 RepID=UPI000D04DFA7|nr:aspartate/glutamate racemase family protein [Allonocardiopsis opalescens]
MRIALIDSGLGLLSTAAALRRARPDADLVLSMDPDHMPWGPRTPADVAERALAGARAALPYRPDALVVACNTASVHALDRLRAEFEPGVPVIGTVPAVKPAAATGGPVAVWATPATTGSAYQRELIERFAAGVPVAAVACPGLAEAVESADSERIDAAVADAAGRSPADTAVVVLGCTHYDLVQDRIVSAFARPVALMTAAGAVAAQTLRRLGARPEPDAAPTGALTVLASGRAAGFPERAAGYPAACALTTAQPLSRSAARPSH